MSLKLKKKWVSILYPKQTVKCIEKPLLPVTFAVVAHLYKKFSIPLLTLFLLPVVFLKFKILQLVASLRVLWPV